MEYNSSSAYAFNHQSAIASKTYCALSSGSSALQRHPPSPPVRLRDTEQVSQPFHQQRYIHTKENDNQIGHHYAAPQQLGRYLSTDSSKDSGMGSYTHSYVRSLENDFAHKNHRGWSPDGRLDNHAGCHGYHAPHQSRSPEGRRHRVEAKALCGYGHEEFGQYKPYNASAYHHGRDHGRQDVARKLATEFHNDRDLSPVSTSSSIGFNPSLGVTAISQGSSDNLSVVSSRSRSQDDLDVSLEHETKCKTSSPRSETDYRGVSSHQKMMSQKMYKSTPDLSQKHLAQHLQQQQQQQSAPCGRACSDEGQNRGQKSRKHHRSRSGKSEASSKETCDLREPLNSARLRPIRQKTRNAVVNIMSDGDVCLEFIKSKEGEERVIEVFRIAPDGTSIQIYTPSGDKGGLPVTDRPSPPQADGKGLKHYMFQELPDKYWKRYQYATRFVRLVRSKTPKVTLYTPTAKAMLMENSPNPDFEVTFFEGGKFSHSSEGTRIIRKDGTSLTIDGTTSVQHLAPEMQQMWNYVAECRQRCEDIEKLLTSIESSSMYSYFPVTLGRRPHSDHSSIPSPADTHFERKNYPTPKNRQSFETEPSPASMRSFEGTIMSHTTFTGSCPSTAKMSPHSSHSRSPPGTVHSHQGASSQHRSVVSNPNRSPSTVTNQIPIQNAAPIHHSTNHTTPRHHAPPTVNHHHQHQLSPGVNHHHQSPPSGQQHNHTTTPSLASLPAVLCRAFVPGIGWATQFANGEIAVNFNDGSELSIQSSPMLVKHTDPDGTLSRFRGSDQLPGSVRSKLARLPDVMSKLELASAKDFNPQMVQ